MATEQGEASAQEQLVQVLMDHIEEDNYPSTTMMDIIEQSMTPEQSSAYQQVLLEKIRGEHYPSLDMIRRLQALG